MGNPIDLDSDLTQPGSPPAYSAPPSASSRSNGVPSASSSAGSPRHTNAVILAAKTRCVGEQQFQQLLLNAQYQAKIYNAEIEPEHETDYVCSCGACKYRRAKFNRLAIHNAWSKAVKYPGERTYNDLVGTAYSESGGTPLFSRNPYLSQVMSPYGPSYLRTTGFYAFPKPSPKYHIQNIHQTIALNNKLNLQAQLAVDLLEPTTNIWEQKPDADDQSQMVDIRRDVKLDKSEKGEKAFIPDSASGLPPYQQSHPQRQPMKPTGFFAKIFKTEPKEIVEGRKNSELVSAIIVEEIGRWPDEITRAIVDVYQQKTGMKVKIGNLRKCQPIQYLHLLKAGYMEPIPTAWSDQASNPLKFTIEAAGGWRGITPSWRGFEDTAEERLYWVLNHREGPGGIRMKPDFISEMEMAKSRMGRAVEPPPEYFSPTDQCHVQHTTEGYSKQVLPAPFVAYDRPEVASDDTMVLLDVSGSMNFDPIRPIYNQYLITGYTPSIQPKNKDVAKAIVRRFSDALSHHDHSKSGYDLVTFSSSATYIGKLKHSDFDQTWSRVRVGGGTRVMTGWQKCKELHFNKHRDTSTWHPTFGWQAGPDTPMLRLLLLLDGEATDMDEFELDLLGVSWAHITIFLIGVDGCPHHHRHANELQRISDVNHHVSFVDAQGNTPERFVTHELLKRHLGVNLSLSEFTELEQLPAYEAY